MPSCDNEEAVTRLIIHLQDVLLNGCSNCMVCTVNTDIVVILIGKIHHLTTLYAHVKICVILIHAKHLLILTLMLSMGSWVKRNPKFSLYSTVSWNCCYPQVTHAFTYMTLHPYTELDIDNENFKLLECFTVALYNKNCELDNLNEAKKQLFC